jgi:Tfp pilus assembly protein PilF
MASSQWTPRIRRVSGNDQERLMYAASLLRERKFEEAREELEKILDQDDSSLPATMALGIAYQALRKPKEALSSFRRAMEIDPKNAQAPLQAGFAALAGSDQENATFYFNSALQIDPSLPNAHLGLALALQKEEDPSRALEHARAAVRIDPELTLARILIAQFLKKLEKPDAAIQELEAVLRSHPAHPAAAVLLSSLYSDNGEEPRAISLLETTSKLRPEQANVWSALGRLCMKKGDHIQAEEAFRQMATLRPTDVFGPLRIVEAIVPQGKFEEARELLETVPRTGQAAALAHKYFGDIYAAQEIYEDAVNSYRAALMKSKDGATTVAELDRELEGRRLDQKAIVAKYQEYIEAKINEARERLAQQDFQLNPQDFQTLNPWQRQGERQRLSA